MGDGLGTLGDHLRWTDGGPDEAAMDRATSWQIFGTLTPKELELLANKTGATRLGFAVLLKAFVFEGRFPRQKHDVPGAVIVHVANQINVPADLYPRYEWSGRTIEYHRAQIREFLGFREAAVQNGNELVKLARPARATSRSSRGACP